MDLIRLHVLPPRRSGDIVSRLVMTTPATRIVKSYNNAASPWEVFLCPEQAARISIHYYQPRQKTDKKGE